MGSIFKASQSLSLSIFGNINLNESMFGSDQKKFFFPIAQAESPWREIKIRVMVKRISDLKNFKLVFLL